MATSSSIKTSAHCIIASDRINEITIHFYAFPIHSYILIKYSLFVFRFHEIGGMNVEKKEFDT